MLPVRWLFMLTCWPGNFFTFCLSSPITLLLLSRFYVGEDGMTRNNTQGLIDLFTDSLFMSPNTEAVKLHAESPAPVYNYLFSYRGSFSFGRALFSRGDPETMKQDFGACHADDLLYIFRLPFPALMTENDINWEI